MTKKQVEILRAIIVVGIASFLFGMVAGIECAQNKCKPMHDKIAEMIKELE